MFNANESANAMSPTSSLSCHTPARTHFTDDFQNSDVIPPFGSIPNPGSWFIIRIRNSGKYLSIIGGKVCLHEKPHPWGGFRWRCVNTDGWVGFHEFTTGRYLGHGKGNIVAKALKHSEKEYIVVSHQPEGGYHLSVFYEDTNGVQGSQKVLRPLKSDNDGNLLLEFKGLAALWEFCKVESPQQ
ncbi:hypothetical protein BKA56DRAFT_580706 [Ilyonectria sp. MPI-CAGE-AT-0026]|nr:hypothetical protein BKA56DRAFT_580706 [Ilyonectria sp. MPI-CAGE-AT-0026]